MKWNWTLLIGLVLLAGPGCDEKGSEAKSGGGLVTAAAPVQSASVSDASIPTPEVKALSGTGGSVPANDEALAARYQATFDGGSGTGGLHGMPDTGPVNAGSRQTWRTAPTLAPNAQPRKIALDNGSVPAPNTLPKYDLPGPENQAEASAGARGGSQVLLAFEAFQKRFYDTVVPEFSRMAWGARGAKSAGVRQNPTRVTVHHTDGKQTFDEKDTLAAVKNIQEFHMGPQREWDDIAYHFLIDGAGRIVEGRHPDIMGAHVKGANENNIGIALLGDYNKDKPTPAQIESLRRLVSYLALKYRTDPRQKGFLEPHKHYNDTDCPGKNVVAILQQLGKDIDNDTIQLAGKLGQSDGTLTANAFTPLAVTQPASS